MLGFVVAILGYVRIYLSAIILGYFLDISGCINNLHTLDTDNSRFVPCFACPVLSTCVLSCFPRCKSHQGLNMVACHACFPLHFFPCLQLFAVVLGVNNRHYF
jgi:hypothetical protein